MIDLFGKVMIVGLFITFLIIAIALTYGIMDARIQKDDLSQMSCLELKEYIIDKALNVGGFPDIAKDLFKYKCEVANRWPILLDALTVINYGQKIWIIYGKISIQVKFNVEIVC